MKPATTTSCFLSFHFFLALLLTGGASAQQYQIGMIQPTTQPASGCYSSKAMGINNQGQVVGGAWFPNPLVQENVAFLWQNGYFFVLQKPDSGYGNWYDPYAGFISNQGDVVGWAGWPQPDNYIFDYATLWRGGQAVNLGAGDPPSQDCSVAWAINSSGVAVGFLGYDCDPWYHEKGKEVKGVPVKWETSGGQVVGPTPLLSIGSARDINDAGQIVGAGDTFPFLIDNGQYVQLADEQGGAMAINNHGHIVGMLGLPSTGFIWRDGVLDYLNCCCGSAVVNDINDSGIIVGSVNDTAVVWREVSPRNWQCSSLLSLVVNRGGWTSLVSATAINSAGKIVGYGYHSYDYQSFPHGFLLTPLAP